ncbi:outer membrane protein assembly factor BamE [Pontibacter sp. JAM-7]|uniref:outer membrane protein assembly factor BamE n=1 Tax=Pontibacter sp. JAM-7 TaxID=3366581 RepID=UPI003AF6D383
MQTKLIVLFFSLILAGCSGFPGVYKIDVPQGNVVTQDMVDQLRPGMTHNQVRYVLGSPLVTDTFHQNRWDYIYRKKTGKTGEIEQYRLAVLFSEGKLSSLAGSFRPGAGPTLTEQ